MHGAVRDARKGVVPNAPVGAPPAQTNQQVTKFELTKACGTKVLFDTLAEAKRHKRLHEGSNLRSVLIG